MAGSDAAKTTKSGAENWEVDNNCVDAAISALSEGGARLEKDGIAFPSDVKSQITTGRESGNSTVKWERAKLGTRIKQKKQ
jgi:hypothetical protein